MNRRFLMGAGVAALVTSVTACGDSETSREEQIENYAAEQGIDLDVDIDGDKMVVQQDIGGVTSQVGMGLDLPDGFPDDVALFPGMQVYGASIVPMGYSVAAIGNDGVDAVTSYLTDQMTANGWADESTPSPAPTMRNLRFTKDGRAASYTLVPGSDDNTNIQISVVTLP